MFHVGAGFLALRQRPFAGYGKPAVKGRTERNALGLTLKCCSSELKMAQLDLDIYFLCVLFYDCECKLSLPF